MAYSCLQNKIPPIVIPVNQKQKYISFLNNCDEQGLTQFAMELQNTELQRMQMIHGGEKIDIQIQTNIFSET